MGYTTKFEIGDFIFQPNGRNAMGIVREIRISNLANLSGVVHYIVEANGSTWELAEHAAELVKSGKSIKGKPYKFDCDLDDMDGKPYSALREIRKLKKLTQEELSERTGITQCNISSYEKGHKVLGVSSAKKLARELGVDFRTLL